MSGVGSTEQTPENKITELEEKLKVMQQEYADRETQLLLRVREANKESWQVNALLVSLQAELLNPVHAIINNSEVLHFAVSKDHRDRLYKANLRAAQSLERTTSRLVDLARIATDDFRFTLGRYSLHSLTHEALLLSEAALSESSTLQLTPVLECADFIVDADRSRVVNLISSAIISISESLPSGKLNLSLMTSATDNSVDVKWHITVLDSPHYVDLKRSLEPPAEGNPLARRSTLVVQYIKSIAAMLEADIEVQEVPQCLIIKTNLKVIHKVDLPETNELSKPWADQTVVYCEEPPESFNELFLSAKRLPSDKDLATFISENDAKLLVLYQPEGNAPDVIANNLRYCIESKIPVMLRASKLSYDQFNTYRENLDVIVLESSGQDILAKYAIGLASHDRREDRRPAEIH